MKTKYKIENFPMNTRVETEREEIDFLKGFENTHEAQECHWRIFNIYQLHIPSALPNCYRYYVPG